MEEGDTRAASQISVASDGCHVTDDCHTENQDAVNVEPIPFSLTHYTQRAPSPPFTGVGVITFVTTAELMRSVCLMPLCLHSSFPQQSS